MYIAVLSPCLLKPNSENAQKELEHYKMLDELLKKLFKFTTFKFEYYLKAPYAGYKMDMPQYKHNHTLNNHVTINIFGMIQKMLISNHFVDLEKVSAVRVISDFKLPKGDISDAFLSYLNYLKQKESVVFIGEDNLNVSKPLLFSDGKDFEVTASTLAFLELSKILIPFLNTAIFENEIFPRKDFCNKYNQFV